MRKYIMYMKGVFLMYKTTRLENAVKVELPNDIFPEGFYILVIPSLDDEDVGSNGKCVMSCILGRKGYGAWEYMFGLCEDMDEAIIIAESNAETYVEMFLEEHGE